MAKAKAEPLFGEISEQPRGAGDLTASERAGTFATFLTSLEAYLVKKAKEAIDTPQERAELEDMVLNEFDQYIAPRLRPIIAGIARRNLLQLIDDGLTELAK